MKMIFKRATSGKVLSLVLALFVGATFVPMLPGNSSFASSETGSLPAETVSETDSATSEVSPEGILQTIDSEPENIAGVEEPSPERTGMSGMKAKGAVQAKGAETPSMEEYVSVTTDLNGSIFTVTGSITPEYAGSPKNYTFGRLFVDTTLVQTINGTSINASIDMSQFSLGYHTVFLEIRVNGKVDNGLSLIQQYVPSNNISIKPTYKGSKTVYSDSLTIYPYTFGANMEDDLYLEYSSDGGVTWYQFGPMQSNLIQVPTQISFDLTGLTPNTKYKTRLCYGTYVTYPTDYLGDGQAHFFGGPRLNTGTIKTGQATKPSIKSVKVKAVDVKFHKVRHYGLYTGVYLYTEKFWTHNIRVTVKLKKKPGTKGLKINGKYVKGNKKKYSVKFKIYPNITYKKPTHGLKYDVTIQSYQGKSYGGFSPAYSKTKKVH